MCECGDGSVAGGGVGAPPHAHYVRGCAWECDDGFELDATGNACMVSPPPPPSPLPSPPPPPSPMLPGYLQIAGGYYMIESGSCGSALISTKSECEAAATALDLSDKSANDLTWQGVYSYRPPGCVFSSADGEPNFITL